MRFYVITLNYKRFDLLREEFRTVIWYHGLNCMGNCAIL
jgi:hypothetical protein